jgi:hypothetical protein
MPDYRLYCLDDLGKIAEGEWIEAKSDDEAIVMARAKRLSVDCELWEGNRLIAQVPAHVA